MSTERLTSSRLSIYQPSFTHLTRWITHRLIDRVDLCLERSLRSTALYMLPQDRLKLNWYCSNTSNTLETLFPRSVFILVYSRCIPRDMPYPTHFSDGCTGSLVIKRVMWKREELPGNSSGYSSSNNNEIKKSKYSLVRRNGSSNKR